MYKKIINNMLSICLVSSCSWGAIAQADVNPLQVLKAVDAYRSESNTVKVSATVRAYKQDELRNSKQYDVYSTSAKRSLVVFKSDSEKGQKVLMKGSDYWMFMPKSRRPIRITPMQKLLGEASLGDIATLSWSEDYTVKQTTDMDSLWQFELHAISPKLSYQKIILNIRKDNYFPEEAELYLRSGMHAKTAQFEQGERNGKQKVTAMALHDEMRKGHKTVIEYDLIEPISVPDRLFNPQILIRSDLDRLLTE
ncbi:outer membrane lipoprotein-sorting protein [Pseudoalteromonas sp. MMG012]|uniref:outer membrane lipoprotein-sorting protein n=1 Tax=Pseudoalteromonas sp. MMG012 TaxID=2822686 RepID=UPI001B3A205C|nr:outer membrane lipoprotein-sorting protein [Pseudoalteromonas sp. MMG012]MBQ4849982.1 outer membrane lipoprotein-sorting protein [Pseudoalteromonas sp. MMG012]